MNSRLSVAMAFCLAVACATIPVGGLPTAVVHAAASSFTMTITPGPECYDGQDNDEDGLVDYPDDDDCESETDTTEGIPPPPAVPPSSAGPQPSGGSGLTIEPTTSVSFAGYAYPGSRVTLLRDAQVAARVTVGTDARFQVALSELNPGNYLFLLYAESTNGRRSTLHPFPLLIQKGSLTSIAGVVLNPTVALDKQAVRAGGVLGISGDTAPGALLSATLLPGNQVVREWQASPQGTHTSQFSTQGLPPGEYTLKLSATIDGFRSGYGLGQTFTVGETDIPVESLGPCLQGDMNCDGRVNLVDFSVAAFWYRRPLTGAVVQREREALNNDGIIDLRDVSIIAYFWTG